MYMAFEPSRDSQLTEKQLNFGYWWLEHKILIRNIGMWSLGIVGGGLLLFGGYGLVDWYAISGPKEQALLGAVSTDVVNTDVIRAHRPQPVTVDGPFVVPSSPGTNDLVVIVHNPNADRWASFRYAFADASGNVVGSGTGFALPSMDSTIIAAHVKADAGAPTFAMPVMQLTSIDRHAIADYASWSAARLQLVVTNTQVTPPLATDTFATARVQFDVENQTNFSYRNVAFSVLLRSAGSIVGAQIITLDHLNAGEKQTVGLTWLSPLPSGLQIEVKPMVNIFDDQSYLTPNS